MKFSCHAQKKSSARTQPCDEDYRITVIETGFLTKN